MTATTVGRVGSWGGWLVVASLVVGASLAAAEPASASCAAPTSAVRPTTVPANGWVTVTGEGWMSDCPDTGGPLPDPVDVTVEFSQGDRTDTIATVTPDAGYAIDATISLPVWATPGSASVVVAGDATPIRVTAAVDGLVPPAGTLGARPAQQHAERGTSVLYLAVLAALVVLAAYPWWRQRRRRREGPGTVLDEHAAE